MREDDDVRFARGRCDVVRSAMSSLGRCEARYDGTHLVALDGVDIWRGFFAGSAVREEWIEEWIGDGPAGLGGVL